MIKIRHPLPFFAITALLVLPFIFSIHITNGKEIEPTHHTSNVAIILSSSTFYHNYRHTANALAIYQSLRHHGGFTDDNIILMLADDVSCNARNVYKDHIYTKGEHGVDLNENVQIDYIGGDATIDNFFRVLLGRHTSDTPGYQRLPQMDEHTNVFIYITGHGGDSFFKFRDLEDFTTKDWRGVLEQMQIMKRFQSLLFLADTCQAFSLAPNTKMEDEDNNGFQLRNVYTVASSLKGENSYAHHMDENIGHSVIDRYVYTFTKFMGGLTFESKGNWKVMDRLNLYNALVGSMYTYDGKPKLGANIGWSDWGCDRRIKDVPLSDFFVMKQGREEAKLFTDAVEF
jgi:phosphatidylinositol glycan class K